MTEQTIKRIRLVYGIVLSAVTAAAGLCLIAACVGIYRSGDRPFSPEAVAAAFAPIAVPVYLCLALVIGGFLLDFLCPPQRKKPSAGAAQAMALHRLHTCTDLSPCDTSFLQSVRAQQRSRRVFALVGILLLIAGAAVFLPYALNMGHFHQTEINTSMIRAMWVLLPCLAVPFVWAVIAAIHAKGSMAKELELMRSAAAHGAVRKEPPTPRERKNLLTAARWVLAAAALLLLVYGLLSGGAADVLTKAVNICTECIGLG